MFNKNHGVDRGLTAEQLNLAIKLKTLKSAILNDHPLIVITTIKERQEK